MEITRECTKVYARQAVIEFPHADGVSKWIEEATQEARRGGADYVRVSTHEYHPNLYLVEGFKMPSPYFFMTPEPEHTTVVDP